MPEDNNTNTNTNTNTGDWFAGADPVIVGHIQSKGWHDKPVNEVALAAIKAHREAEGFIGAPAAELARVPKPNATAEEQKAFWSRVGAPADPKDYDFTTVKTAKGEAPSERIIEGLRSAFGSVFLPKDTATRIAAEVVKINDAISSEADTLKAGKLVEQKAALATNWGKNFDANMFVSKQAAQKLGVSPEAIAALENVVGYDQVMDMFLTLGKKMGEDRFVDGGDGPNSVMTKEQAKAKLEDLKKDEAYVKRYLAGGAVEKQEMTALNLIINGQG